jgi:DNA-binding MarR family transcriptional regulator
MKNKKQHVALSNFRYALARFLRFSERASRAAGITPKQYLLLLHICGTPDREWASVGELAARLQSSNHGTVALIDRCEAARLVRRLRNKGDARRVEIHATQRGRKLLERIAARHRRELQSLRAVFRVAGVNWLRLGSLGGTKAHKRAAARRT